MVLVVLAAERRGRIYSEGLVCVVKADSNAYACLGCGI